MIGDKGRETSVFGRSKQFDSLRYYSGRAFVASDANEAQDLLVHAREQALIDVIGRLGQPRRRGGFEVTGSGGQLTVSAGELYVHGARFTWPEDQTFALEDLGSNLPQQELVLVACCTKSEVDFLDHEFIRDDGLGGPDTAGRMQNVVRLELMPISDLANANGLSVPRLKLRAKDGHTFASPKLAPRNGRAGFGLSPVAGDENDLCRIYEEGGYTRHGNFNYVVQIHDGGMAGDATFKWAFDDVRAQVLSTPDGLFLAEEPSDDQRKFTQGKTIEVKGARERHLNLPGVLGQILTLDASSREITLTADAAAAVGAMQGTITITRWDHSFDDHADGVPTDTSAVALEGGVTVTFKDNLASGDYWYCAARVRTGEILWPPREEDADNGFVPPFNWGPHCVALASIGHDAGAIGTPKGLLPVFPDLTHITAEDVTISAYPPCDLTSGMTVQEALERLCDLTGDVCTITVRPDRIPDALKEAHPKLAGLPTLAEALEMLAEINEGLTPTDKPIEAERRDAFTRRVALRFTQGNYHWPFEAMPILQDLHSFSLETCSAAPVSLHLDDWLVAERCLNVRLDGIALVGEARNSGLSIFGGKSIEMTNCSLRRVQDEMAPPLKLRARRRITLRETRVHVSGGASSTGYLPAIQVVDARAQTLFENVQSNGSLILGPIVPVKEKNDPVRKMLDAAVDRDIKTPFEVMNTRVKPFGPEPSSPGMRVTGCKLLGIHPDAAMMDKLSAWVSGDSPADDSFEIKVADHVLRERSPVLRGMIPSWEFVMVRDSNDFMLDLDALRPQDFRLKIPKDAIPDEAKAPFYTLDITDSELVRGTSILVARHVGLRNTRFEQFGDHHCVHGAEMASSRGKMILGNAELENILMHPYDSQTKRRWYPVCFTVGDRVALSGNIGSPEQGIRRKRFTVGENERYGLPLILDFSRRDEFSYGEEGRIIDKQFELFHQIYDTMKFHILTFHTRRIEDR
jgi:hypothetical protein